MGNMKKYMDNKKDSLCIWIVGLETTAGSKLFQAGYLKPRSQTNGYNGLPKAVRLLLAKVVKSNGAIINFTDSSLLDLQLLSEMGQFLGRS